jgi:hypothetical protein
MHHGNLNLRRFTEWEVGLLLAAICVSVCYKLLTGGVNLARLLSVKSGGAPGISPARIQLLILTVAAGLYYLFKVLDNPANGFPELPQELLLALGGSHTLYLTAKGSSILRQNSATSGEPDSLQ